MKDKIIEILKRDLVSESDHTSLNAHVGGLCNKVDLLREKLADEIIELLDKIGEMKDSQAQPQPESLRPEITKEEIKDIIENTTVEMYNSGHDGLSGALHHRLNHPQSQTECADTESVKSQCLIHSTDWNGKCFDCGVQVFIRDEKQPK